MVMLQSRPVGIECFKQLFDFFLSAELLLKIANERVNFTIHQWTSDTAQRLKDGSSAQHAEAERVQCLR